MISIVLYGRNDNYGYNLHKRAALSFNCMAEVLTGNGDEILFVDYNTPDDFPTFPEAIQDTLTAAARQRLRILRVRPHVHERFRSKTRLIALEPVSRNVAIRRSNPENRWILSTNTDMIFVPTRRPSLTEIVRDLPRGFYHAPRLEIPETLWEGLDRAEAREAIDAVREWGRTLHLNEVVLGAKTILYDGPGDFQLMERDELFANHGFDEEMILGWHVDSNIAKRLYLLHGKVGDLGGEVFGYHCDHTRQITPAHSHNRTENDWRRFVDNTTRSDIPEQAATWGCPDEDVEEIRLTENTAAVYVSALREAIGEPLDVAPVVTYTGEMYNRVDYDPRHVLPFLLDVFSSSPRDTDVAWTGGRQETLRLFAAAWGRLGFRGRILIDEAGAGSGALASVPEAIRVDRKALVAEADVFIVDFGMPDGLPSPSSGARLPRELQRTLGKLFLTTVQDEQARCRAKKPPRRIIAVNAINNEFERIVLGYVGAGLTPFASRLRQGFVHPPLEGTQDLTGGLFPGDAAVRGGAVIRSRGAATGHICYGPYQHFFAGVYLLEFAVSGVAAAEPDEVVAVCELRSGLTYLGHSLVTARDLAAGVISVELHVTDELAADFGFLVEALLRTVVPVDITISKLTARRIGEAGESASREERVLALDDLVPLLWVGSAGARRAGAIVGERDRPGYLTYGPYWRLPPGSYQAEVALDWPVDVDASAFQPVGFAEVVLSERRLGTVAIRRGERDGPVHVVRFAVPPESEEDSTLSLELRVWTNGVVPIAVTRAALRRGLEDHAAEASAADWLPFLQLGPAGRWTDAGVEIAPGQRGYVAYGPYWTMRPGRYRVTTEIRAQADASVPESTPLFTFEVLSGPRLRALRSVTAKDRRDGALDLEFEVHEGEGDNALPIEFRVGSRGVAGGVVCSVKAERMGDPVRDAPSLDIAAGDLDWLPFLQLGPAGQWSDTGVAIVAGQRGYVAYGPYWTMPPGRYRVTIDLHIGVDAGVPHATPLLVLEAMSGPRLRGFRTVTADWRGDARLDFDFEIHEGEADEVPPIEIRLGSTGAAGGAVRSIVPQRIGDPVQDSPWVDLATGDLDWLAAMQLGRAGDWGDEGVVIVPGQPGFVVYGPYWIMRRGRYRLTAKFRSNVDAGIRDSTPLFTIEVLSGSRLRAMRSVTAKHRGEAALELDFEVHEDEAERALPIEFRIGSSGLAGGTVLALMPRRIGDPRHETEWFDPGSGDLDWLSVMQLAPAGEWSDSGVDVTAGQRGFVVYGPYVTLQPGRYRLTTRMQADVVDGVAGTTPLFTFEVVSGHRLRGFRTVTAADGGESTVELEFEVHEGEAAGPLPIELRIGSTGVAGGAIHSVTPQRIGEPIQETPWIEVAISERAVGHGRARAVWGVLAGDREVPAALSLVYGAVRKYPERVREKVRGIVGRFDRNR